MKLSVLMQALSLSLDNRQDINIDLITQNSKETHANSLFVCISGLRADGHTYAINAYQNGCRAFLATRPLSLPSDATVFTVPDTRRALAKLACTFYGNPSHQLRVIGITGTKGKTTVACLLREILEQNGVPCGYIGTNGVLYKNHAFASQNTTPDPITLQKNLYDMRKAGCAAAVVEISSQALKQYRADGTVFEACIFTNLSRDHIGEGEHADMADYMACKRRLFTDFPMKAVIYQADDEKSAEILSNPTAQKRIPVSMQNAGNYTATDLCLLRAKNILGSAFTLQHGEISTPCELSLIGEINVSNALLAIATAAECFEIPLPLAAKSLKNARISGRSETVALPNGAIAVIDYAHNGESLRQILTGLRAYAPHRLLCLFGSVGSRTLLRRRELGEVAAQLADFCILTSDNPGKEAPEHIIADILQGFAQSDTSYVCIPNREEAILFGIKEAKKGDILLLAGKGHETYQLIGDKMLPFSEKDILLGATLQQS